MFEITKGYKQGRGVIFYDLLDALEGKTREMVSKDEVVKLTEDGQVSNAKIQWWEGKPIVRCSNKNLPLVKIDESGSVIGVTHQAVRSGNSEKTSVKNEKAEHIVDVSSKAVVVGKLSNRKPKVTTTFAGYDRKAVFEQQELNRSISYAGLNTLNDLFNQVASEFNLKEVEVYRGEIAKKVNLSRGIAGINRSELLAIQNSFAMYMMNMAYKEINQAYMKYKIA